MAQIHELMPKVMADVGAIPKAHRNKAQSYDFRSIEDALNVVQPVLVKHSVSLQFEASDYETTMVQEAKAQGQGTRTVYRATLTMRVTFYAPDGSSVSNVSAGEGMDYGGDKATNKALAAAFKYAMFLGLCIPIKGPEIDDSDRDQPGEKSESQQSHPHVDENKKVGLAASEPETPKPGDYSQSVHGPCRKDQIERIVQLAKDTNMPKEALAASLKKRSVSRISELTWRQAEDLIEALQEKRRTIEDKECL